MNAFINRYSVLCINCYLTVLVHTLEILIEAIFKLQSKSGTFNVFGCFHAFVKSKLKALPLAQLWSPPEHSFWNRTLLCWWIYHRNGERPSASMGAAKADGSLSDVKLLLHGRKPCLLSSLPGNFSQSVRWFKYPSSRQQRMQDDYNSLFCSGPRGNRSPAPGEGKGQPISHLWVTYMGSINITSVPTQHSPLRVHFNPNKYSQLTPSICHLG